MTTLTNALAAVDLRPDTYHADPRLSHSKLEAFRRRRRKYFAQHIARTMPMDEPTDAMRLGTLVDLLVLTPERVAGEIAMRPPCDRRTKEGKATWAKFCEASQGKLVVDLDAYDMAHQMRDAVLAHPTAARLLARGKPQTIITWTDEATGIECRSMRDWFDGEWNEDTLLDLKTCRDVSPRGFSNQAASLGYVRQQAMYVDGHHEATGNVPQFAFVCVESTAPYSVAVYQFDDEAVAMAHSQNQDTMRALAKCMETGDWRDEFEKEAKVLGLPRWVNFEHEWDV